MSTSSDVDIRLRLKQARQTAKELRQVAGELDGLGRRSKRASRDMGFLKSASAGVSQSIGGIGGAARRSAYVLSGGFATALGFGVRAGLKFNAGMEQSRVAFENFLGSGEKANAFLSRLYKLAANTPFEFADLTKASVKLLGFGMDAERTASMLTTLGDAVAGVGGGPEQIDSVVRAVGQIQAKGKLSQEELNQMAEAGIGAGQIIRKQLGMTKADFASTFTPGNQIGAKKALDALQKGLDKAFGGSAAKQAKTFNGQLSSMKDYLAQTAGVLTEPIFYKLRDDLFPGLTAAAKDVSAIFKRTDLTTDEKWDAARKSIRKNVGPFVRDMERELKAAHIDEKLGEVIEWAIPKMADAGAKAAPKVAGAFVSAFAHSGAWGQLFILGLLAKRLGVFKVLGSRAADKMGDAFAANVSPAIGRRKDAMKPGLSRVGRWLGRTVGIAAGIAIAYEVLKAVQAQIGGAFDPITHLYDAETDPTVARGRRMAHDPKSRRASSAYQRRYGKTIEERFGSRTSDAAMRFRLRTGDPSLIPGSPGVPRDYRPKGRAPKAARASRMDPVGLDRPIHTTVEIDGREVARAVGRATDKARNRR